MKDEAFQQLVAIIIVRSFFLMLFGYFAAKSFWAVGSGDLNQGFGYAVFGLIYYGGCMYQRLADGVWPWDIR